MLNSETVALYKSVKQRIKNKIISTFHLNTTDLYLTKPTFFSRITSNPAQTVHDEYWHRHVDRETYGSFHYTSLLYLTTYSVDFNGGRFVFVDGNVTKQIIEPRLGWYFFYIFILNNIGGFVNPWHFIANDNLLQLLNITFNVFIFIMKCKDTNGNHWKREYKINRNYIKALNNFSD